MAFLDGKRSSFPNEVDQFLELYNLPASQRQNARRFQDLRTKENLTPIEQEELNTLTVTLQDYIDDVEKRNLLGDAIVNLQNFFLNETVGFIQEKQNDFQQEINKFNYKNEWQPNIRYYKNNIVTYEGNTYIAKVENINQLPTNEDIWGMIAKKGDKGAPSLNINYKGDYDSSISYVLGDAVIYGGLWYYAKKNTKGNTPTNTEYWELHPNQTIKSNIQPFDSRLEWIDTTYERN